MESLAMGDGHVWRSIVAMKHPSGKPLQSRPVMYQQTHWVGMLCWSLPGRLIHAWRAGTLWCAGSARLFHMCCTRFPCRVGRLCRVGSLCQAIRPWRYVYCWDCICSLLRHLHRTFIMPTIAGWLGMVCSPCPVPGHRWRCRKLCWTTSTTLATCLLCWSRMTRQITTAGSLARQQGWGCRLGHWTAYPVLGTRPPRWSLLSHWIMMMRTGRSCHARCWPALPASVTGPSRSWCWTVMITAMAVGRVTPFRPVSRRTTVSGVGMKVSAPIFISGTVVMTIRPRPRPGCAIGLWRSHHFRLHPAGTVTSGWLVGLWLWFVMSRLVRLTTLLFLRSQNPLRCMDLDAVVHGILQLLSRRGGFPLQLLRLGLFMSVPVFWQPCFRHCTVFVWCIHARPRWSNTVDNAHGYRLVSESESTCEISVRLLVKRTVDHVNPSSCDFDWLRHQTRNKPGVFIKFGD